MPPATKSKIEWCDYSWSVVTGCTQLGPGCDNCYAKSMINRFKRQEWSDIQTHEDKLELPNWPKGSKIFVAHMGDLFHSDVPFKFINKVFYTMMKHAEYTFLVLTKRTGRMAYWANTWWPGSGVSRCLECGHDWIADQPGRSYDVCEAPTCDSMDIYIDRVGLWPNNVWAGASVENERVISRLDQLAEVQAPVRFCSYEPALELVDFRSKLYYKDMDSVPMDVRGKLGISGKNGVNWMIAGGESGSAARPSNPDWYKAVLSYCELAQVPFFFKQYGTFAPASQFPDYPLHTRVPFYNEEDVEQSIHGEVQWYTGVARVGKKKAGAELFGREYHQFPAVT